MLGIVRNKSERPVQNIIRFWVQERGNNNQHRKLGCVEVICLAEKEMQEWE
jgi:hypothetical protein